mmetsp:Transcript_44972/g.143202  ORF Transcript_44972/g.143202 Transcript_44972/m.143202 type:complete len:301 (+) Transcript_44972:182-1084(+)
MALPWPCRGTGWRRPPARRCWLTAPGTSGSSPSSPPPSWGPCAAPCPTARSWPPPGTASYPRRASSGDSFGPRPGASCARSDPRHACSPPPGGGSCPPAPRRWWQGPPSTRARAVRRRPWRGGCSSWSPRGASWPPRASATCTRTSARPPPCSPPWGCRRCGSATSPGRSSTWPRAQGGRRTEGTCGAQGASPRPSCLRCRRRWRGGKSPPPSRSSKPSPSSPWRARAAPGEAAGPPSKKGSSCRWTARQIPDPARRWSPRSSSWTSQRSRSSQAPPRPRLTPPPPSCRGWGCKRPPPRK